MSIQLDKKIEKAHKLDKIDYKIICQLLLGSDSKSISSILHIALSTIQRRTRAIIFANIITREYTPNCQILGISKALLHIYLSDGKLRETAEKISEMEGILSVTIHVGNSDIVSEFVYDNSEDLVDIIASIKDIEGVTHIVWSEEIYRLKTHKENILKSFNKYWQNNNIKNNKNNNNDIRKNHNNINNKKN